MSIIVINLNNIFCDQCPFFLSHNRGFLRKLVQVHKLGMTQKTSDHSSDSEIVNAVQCTCEDGIIVWDEPNRPDTKYMQEQSGN